MFSLKALLVWLRRVVYKVQVTRSTTFKVHPYPVSVRFGLGFRESHLPPGFAAGVHQLAGAFLVCL